MRVAGIDIGTNTFRYLVADVEGNRFVTVSENRQVVRLGERLGATGVICSAAIERAVSCLSLFVEEIKRYGPLKVISAATSAVREAENSAGFLLRVKAETGLTVNVIAGEIEAEITLRGVLSGLAAADTGIEGRAWYGNRCQALSEFMAPEFMAPEFMAIDIGGGSTEFIYSSNNVPMVSLNIGVVHLYELFLKSDPPSPLELADMRAEILYRLQEVGNRAPHLVGTAGTITTLAFLDSGEHEYSAASLNGYILTRDGIEKIYKNMLKLTGAERLEKYKIEKGREDVIISGAVILLTLMDKFDYNHLHLSDYGLREGLVLQAAENGAGSTLMITQKV